MATLRSGNTIDRAGVDLLGLTHDGTYFWHSNYANWGKIFQVDYDGTVITSWDVYYGVGPGNYALGLAWDGEDIWAQSIYLTSIVPTAWGARVHRYSTLGALEDSFPLVTGTGSMSGLGWDGTYLWSQGAGAVDKVYQYQTDGTDLSNFDTPGSAAYGLTYYNGYLWSIDNIDKKLYKLDTSGNVIAQWDLPTGIGLVAGLTWDGTHFWCTDRTNSLIRQLLFPSGDYVAMSIDPTGVPWYAWITGNDIKVNLLDARPSTPGTAVTVDSTGDYDSVSECLFDGGILRVVARASADQKPYLFYSSDMGATWTGPVDMS